MIDDSMKKISLLNVQPKHSIKENFDEPELHEIVFRKITSFKETDDGRYLIDLKGLIRFKIIKELETKNIENVKLILIIMNMILVKKKI